MDIPKSLMLSLYNEEKLSDSQIANKFNYSYSIINRLRTNTYRIKSRSNKIQKTKINLELLNDCMSKKMTYDSMEKILGVSRAIIHCHIKRVLKEFPI